MKADQVRPHHTTQYLPSPRKHPYNFIGRKGNMLKESNGCIRQPFSQHAWQEQKLIVMHPNSIFRIGLVQNSITEFFVDPYIGVPMGLIVIDILGKIMKSRPYGLVAETFIKFSNILFCQKYRSHFQRVQLFNYFSPLFLVFYIVARPANPYIFPLFIYRSQSCGQPPSTWLKLKLALFYA